MSDTLLWFTSGSGRIELQMTLEQAQSASHQGECATDVLALSQIPEIKAQLDQIDASMLVSELLEDGAWDAAELEDHNRNLQRILWLAAGDIVDNAPVTKRGARP